MSHMDAMEILVIILSVTLAVFLILAIILTILMIRVTVQIRNVAATAQHTADTIDAVTTKLSRLATPMTIGKFMLRRFKQNKK